MDLKTKPSKNVRLNMKPQEQIELLDKILENSLEFSIIGLAPNGRILAWNEGAKVTYGYEANDVIDKYNYKLLLHSNESHNAAKLEQFLTDAYNHGKAMDIFECTRKNNERFFASVLLTLLKSPTDEVLGFLIISKDLTQQFITNEQLRSKSEILANMSHEFRTPLTAIIGFTKLMLGGALGPISEKQKKYLGDMVISSEHLLQLVDDVINLSKWETGKFEFYPQPVDIKKLIFETYDVLRDLIRNHKINLSIDVDDHLTDITLDPAKFKQLIYNYLSNAIKFTPEGGDIHISAIDEDNDNFRLSITDSAMDIKEDDLNQLFIAFQQPKIDKKYQGVGVGLAFLKRLVEAQNGIVGIKKTDNKGSEFFAILPKHQK